MSAPCAYTCIFTGIPKVTNTGLTRFLKYKGQLGGATVSTCHQYAWFRSCLRLVASTRNTPILPPPPLLEYKVTLFYSLKYKAARYWIFYVSVSVSKCGAKTLCQQLYLSDWWLTHHLFDLLHDIASPMPSFKLCQRILGSFFDLQIIWLLTDIKVFTLQMNGDRKVWKKKKRSKQNTVNHAAIKHLDQCWKNKEVSTLWSHQVYMHK